MQNDMLMHYGTKTHSGRYPWGSGEHPYQRLDKGRGFMSDVQHLKEQGLSERDRARALLGEHATTTQLRAKIKMAKEAQRSSDRAQVIQLSATTNPETGKLYNNSEIARLMGVNESTVRSWLDPVLAERNDKTRVTADMLKEQLKTKEYIDVGAGTQLDMGVSDGTRKTALAMLQEEGYHVYPIQVDQMGTSHRTTISVLTGPDKEYKDVYSNLKNIHTLEDKRIDVDGSILRGNAYPIQSIDSKRVQINYAEDGGTLKDGVIEIRRGVDDISLGNSSYAQVRIGVDDTHYLKGMAVYSDDLPKGVDIRFNTNKAKGTPLTDVLKPMKNDPTNPFGSALKSEDQLKMVQRYYTDKNGKKQLSAINVIREEGDWDTWAKTLASQFLSKQPLPLAKQQLNLDYQDKLSEFDSIKKLTNPTVKKILLESFSKSCDAAAVDLKAAALPRQASKVILPVPSMKDTEVYAPHLKDGETVVLVRFPHGGQFELPKLKVNNKNKDAINVMGKTPADAIGINPKVAERLSGADFDGDTVVVLPVTRNGKNVVNIQTKPSLEGLVNFDPKESYKEVPGMRYMSKQNTQRQMGVVSNLITDMTLQGASDEELARAVRHSMVVIDAEKHKLNYTQSAKDNNIRELQKKYQPQGGASTLISRSKSEVRVNERKDQSYSKSTIDPKTGERVYNETGRSYVNKKGVETKNTTTSTRMYEAKDAKELMSSPTGLPMERAYASYANQMKALGNAARKEWLAVSETKANPSAKKAYAKEVESLNRQLIIAQKNQPRERQAQIIANVIVAETKADNPSMTSDDEKKLRGRALGTARSIVGAKKQKVSFTEREWEAVQAGAVSPTKLKQMINNADLDEVKKLSMPKQNKGLSTAQISLIKARKAAGYTLDDLADSFGVSASTISRALNQ